MSEPNSKKFKMNKETKTDSSSANDAGGSKRSLTDVSTHNFAKIKETSTFVDKTLFIETFFTDDFDVVLLTAPRAFGKSTLMDMLKQFLLGKTSLFKGLKICTEKNEFFLKHCIPHPVIHIDLSDVRGSNFAEVKMKLALAVNKAFREHGYLMKRTDVGALIWASENLRNDVLMGDLLETFEKYCSVSKCNELSVTDLQFSLDFLSEVLHTHYEENVFILIDEYDAAAVSMVWTTYWNEDEIALIDNLLRRFMAVTLKANKYVERSLIFAHVRLAASHSADAARVIHHYPFLHTRYTPYFGFTEEEVEQLLQRPEVKNICGDPETIRRWYGGYIVSGKSTLKIYSSWSVLNHLEDSIKAKVPKFSPHCIDTGLVQNIKSLFTEPLIRREIEQVITDDDSDGIRIRMVKSLTLKNIKSLNELISLEFDELSIGTVDLFLQFLADSSGYFNIIQEDDKLKQQGEYQDSSLRILKVPNFEMKNHLQQICYSEAFNIRKEYDLKSSDIETYVNALISVLEDTSEGAFVDLAKAVVALFSEKNITNEDEIQNVLFTLAYNSRYFVTHSEIQINKNKKGPAIAPNLDMVITMKRNGIIFEFKVDSKFAEEALKQIEKFYCTKFEEPDYEYISKRIYAGLAFNTKEKKVFITYKIENEGESKSVCSDDKS